MKDDLIDIGTYRQEYNTSTGQSIPCGPIYQSTGFGKHVWNHHPEDAEYLLEVFQKVIDEPDYVGKHPHKQNSIELVKSMEKNVLVGIKLHKNNYLYVSTAHVISEDKLNNRLHGGRLQKLC